MAVIVYEKWHAVIASVETINKKVPGGINQFLKFSISNRGKSSFGTRIKNFIGLKERFSFEEFDCYYMHGNRSFVGLEGCDGNLYYFEHKDADLVQQVIDYLEENGLGYDDIYYADPEKIFYEETEKHPLPWLTKDFSTLPKYEDCLKASSVQYSIHPYRDPYRPSSFPSEQGGITFNSENMWVVYQRLVKEGKALEQFEIRNISERYKNAALWNNDLPSLDTFINHYIFGNTSIPEKYAYIIDGSKDKGLTKLSLKLYKDNEEINDLPF